MTTKQNFLATLFLLSNLSLFAQHQFGVQLGVGSYSTPNAEIRDEISDNGMIHITGTSSFGDFATDPALSFSYQYRAFNWFRLAGQLSFFQFKGKGNQNATFTRSSNTGPTTITDLSFPRKISAIRLDGLAYLNLLPKQKIDLLIGSGISYVHRKHNYRSFYQLDFDDQNKSTFVKETYTDDRQSRFGIPVALQLGVPLSEHLQLTGSITGGHYFNADIFYLFTAGLAYQL